MTLPLPHTRRLALTAAFVALAPLAACGGDDDGETLNVYTGRHYDLEAAFEAFEEETGTKIEFLTGGDGELRERIAAEGDETPADVYFTVDAGNLARAAEQDLFLDLDSPILEEAVPANLRDPDGGWYGLTVRARTIMYHPDEVAPDEIPATYEELAEPEWEGRVCLRQSSNVYTQSLVASLIANSGEEEARRIVDGWVANSEILNNDILILESIAEGLCDVGVTNHYYLGRLLDEDPDFPVELAWANQDDRGVHVNISGGGVIKFSDQPELAQQFLEWLATDGQNLFADGNHEYPVNPDVEPDELIATEFGTDFVVDELDAATFGALNPDASRLMDEAGYD